MKAGDLVEVRSREEILSTLDANGALERMPFMPEMLRYCGQRFRVSAIAHKTCDTSHRTGGRRLDATVHLEDLRCDGSAHGGCQATCLLFWKTAWLKPAGEPRRVAARADVPAACDTERLRASTRLPDTEAGEARYSCQATRLYEATSPLPWWDVRQYWRDVASGNVPARRAARVLIVAMARALTRAGFAYRASLWFYDRVHRLLNGRPAPTGTGLIPLGSPTPECNLGLHAGELVRVKTHEDIKQTLNAGSRNRGLWFDHEMAKFCGGEYRVAGRVERIIDEAKGTMLHMKHPCIVLKDVYCTAEYTHGRLLCRRAVTTYWREGWLERASQAAGETSAEAPQASSRVA